MSAPAPLAEPATVPRTAATPCPSWCSDHEVVTHPFGAVEQVHRAAKQYRRAGLRVDVSLFGVTYADGHQVEPELEVTVDVDEGGCADGRLHFEGPASAVRALLAEAGVALDGLLPTERPIAAEKPYLTRDRRALLHAIDAGRVRVSTGGVVVWRHSGHGQNGNVGRRVRELVAAGWAELDEDERVYRLTEAGRLDLAASERATTTDINRLVVTALGGVR